MQNKKVSTGLDNITVNTKNSNNTVSNNNINSNEIKITLLSPNVPPKKIGLNKDKINKNEV